MSQFINFFFDQITFFILKIIYKRVGFVRANVFKNYLHVKKRILKAGATRLKVAFLVCDNSKWQYQSLYEEFASDPKLDPIVLITLSTVDLKHKPNIEEIIKKNYDFFKSQNMNVAFAFDVPTKSYLDLKSIGVDLVFYQQPWELNFRQHPVMVSRYALTYYFPYGFQVIYFAGSYTKKFHSFLYNMFIEDEVHIKAYNKMDPNMYSGNCRAVGNPKLDAYLDKSVPNPNKYWTSVEKFKIIYAPHHSFEGDMLATATFKWSGKEILELVKKHSDKCEWVIKPHPLFQFALLKHKILTQFEIDQFYATWVEMGGSVYSEGNYFDLFKTSDMLVTDSVSFLGEYAPTLNPVLHLINHTDFFNEFGFKIIDNYYRIKTSDELINIFNQVVLDQNDYKKNDRVKNLNTLFSDKSKVSTKIKNLILKDIYN